MGLFRSKNAEKDTSPDSKGTSGSKEPAPAAPSSDTQNASKTGHYRPIFLLAWESALFKAHWAVFVPNASDKTCKTGKYIHVVGNLEKGFEFEVVRGWDINMSRHRPLSPIEIGWVRVELVEDTPTVKGQLAKEAVPRDQLEAILASVAPPSKSLKSASSSEPSAAPGRRKKVELSDCQWWITRCVKELVGRGELIAPQKGLNKGKAPLDILSEAPRH